MTDTSQRSKIGCSHSRAIDDQKLMFYKQRFSNDGPSTARAKQAGDRYDKMYEKYGEITHY